jgi:leader peptidase (prepilin peptidase)/N-methyltransferase
MGLAFPLLYWHHGLSLALVFSLVYTSFLTPIFVIDLEHQLILDKIIYPGMGLALVISPFNSALGLSPGLRVISSVSGGAAGLIIMLLPFLIARGGMGFGDVKMAALVGLITGGFPGFPKVFIALFLSIITGGLAAMALLSLGLKKRRQPIPFGPFLAIGAMAVVVWGGEIQYWYQQIVT